MCNLWVDDQVEMQQHLFHYLSSVHAREVKQALFNWSGIPFNHQTVQHALRWLKRRKWKKFHKEVAAAILEH